MGSAFGRDRVGRCRLRRVGLSAPDLSACFLRPKRTCPFALRGFLLAKIGVQVLHLTFWVRAFCSIRSDR
ncbi:MAG: hypothetical protein EBV33_01830 [Betaproteobacteria bacterium]|nr:hypothetical protein [Betaproteobacteria bacterium]NBQ08347.1 hypothetical protein [Betaproteobacteria bacterium]NCU97387.1 hypothetical protein [Betaproteobacteria bacterium]NCX61537.1 hypothetical protein [Betaproteobacteria bacterium]NCX80903.1 hypothetical protein [Betaproteobacteria bacterium]